MVTNNKQILSEISKSDIGIGKIEKINNIYSPDGEYFFDISTPIKISGWFVDENFDEIDF